MATLIPPISSTRQAFFTMEWDIPSNCVWGQPDTLDYEGDYEDKTMSDTQSDTESYSAMLDIPEKHHLLLCKVYKTWWFCLSFHSLKGKQLVVCCSLFRLKLSECYYRALSAFAASTTRSRVYMNSMKFGKQNNTTRCYNSWNWADHVSVLPVQTVHVDARLCLPQVPWSDWAIIRLETGFKYISWAFVHYFSWYCEYILLSLRHDASDCMRLGTTEPNKLVLNARRYTPCIFPNFQFLWAYQCG